jgi:FAD/FMN-containing dehydrogenase
MAVQHARDRGVEFVVRGGGHGSGNATCDDGIVIDLRHLSQVDVDPATRMARVGGGALLSQLDAAGQAHGLVCPIGVIGHTGIGGLGLGGGMGRLQRHFGLTIDHIRAIELVTADGRVVRASAAEEPELFWGLRGAGTQFGVVTTIELELEPFDGRLGRSVRMWDARHAADIWSIVDRWSTTAPDAFAITFGLGRAVPEADYPDAIAGRPIVFVGFNHSGDRSAVEAGAAALAGAPKPAVEMGGPIDYLQIQTMNDDAMGYGHRSGIDDLFSNGLSPEVLERLVAHVANAPGDAGIGVSVFGGAIARVPDDATAWPTRTARFEVSADSGMWDDPADDAAHLGWAREAMAILQPIATPFGRYTNSISDGDPGAVRSIWGDAKLARLAALKRTWDPENRFRGNHNIAPA